MAIYAICGSTQVLSYSALAQAVSLSATATGATMFRWTLLSAPPGSTASTSVRGNFVNGTSTIQNPTFETDAGIEGSYVFQCIASNATQVSSPSTDVQRGQQVIAVSTQKYGLRLPNDYQYDWASFHNYNLSALEALAPTTLAELNTALGSNCDDITGVRSLTSHTLYGSTHDASTLAELNTRISDATLDADTESRPVSGSAGGDLFGTFPAVTVSGIDGVPVRTPLGEGDTLTYNGTRGGWEVGVVPSGLVQLSTAVAVSGYNDNSHKVLLVSPDEDAIIAAPLRDVREVWPKFSVDISDASVVYASLGSYFGDQMRLILSDGKMYTNVGTVTIDADVSGIGGVDPSEFALGSTGLIHIFAVPTAPGASTFSFVMTETSPTVGGPPSYPIYKYVWSVRSIAVGGVEIQPFIQDGSWSRVWARHSSTNIQLSSFASIDYKPSSNFPTAYQDWVRFNGSDTFPAGLGGGTLGNIADFMPTDFCHDVSIHGHLYVAYGYTYVSGGTKYVAGRILPQVRGGDLGVADAGLDWVKMLMQIYTPWTTSTKDRATGHQIVRLIDNMMSMRFWDCRGEDLNCRIFFTGYKNALYGR